MDFSMPISESNSTNFVLYKVDFLAIRHTEREKRFHFSFYIHQFTVSTYTDGRNFTSLIVSKTFRILNRNI